MKIKQEDIFSGSVPSSQGSGVALDVGVGLKGGGARSLAPFRGMIWRFMTFQNARWLEKNSCSKTIIFPWPRWVLAQIWGRAFPCSQFETLRHYFCHPTVCSYYDALFVPIKKYTKMACYFNGIAKT
jgi:hypothetical protein